MLFSPPVLSLSLTLPTLPPPPPPPPQALVDAGVESDAVRSSTVNDVEALLWRLSYVLQSRGEDYQVRCPISRGVSILLASLPFSVFSSLSLYLSR